MSINSLLNSSILKSLITFSKYKRPIVLNYTTRHPSNLSKCLTEFPGYTKFLYHLLFILLLTSFLAVLTSFCLTEFYDLLSIFAFRPLVGKPLVSLPAVLTLFIFRSSLNLTYNSFFPCSPHQAYTALPRLFLRSSHIHCGSLRIPTSSLIILMALYRQFHSFKIRTTSDISVCVHTDFIP